MIAHAFYQFGLIGWPLDHSLSPALHTNFLQAAGIAGDYNLYPIPPVQNRHDQIESLLLQFRDKGLHGLNITIPHKQTVIPYLDNLTSVARDIGAVNTIYLQESQLIGDNTDAPGFITDLKRIISETQQIGKQVPQSALILGAGGSARAAAYALSRAGWRVMIAARRMEQAQSLVFDLCQASLFQLYPIKLAPADLSEQTPDLIVNTTPVGMSPNIEVSPWPDEVELPSHASLYDLVYNPQVTKLVARARQTGMKATTGLGMLIEQAALSFERWTGFQVSSETKQNVYKLVAEKMSLV